MNARYLILAAAILITGAGIAFAQFEPFPRRQPHGAVPVQDFDERLDMPGRWQMIAQDDGPNVVLFVLNTNTGRVFRLRNAEDDDGGRRAWEEIRPQHAR